MSIATIGRGHAGGGLGRRWQQAGNTVTLLGRDGGDVSDADAVLVAVPPTAITDALAKVTGLDGKVALDATNAFGGRNPGYDSLAHEVRATTNGPVAKAFFASTLDDTGKQRVRRSLLYAAGDGAREVTEQLIRDAGYVPHFGGWPRQCPGPGRFRDRTARQRRPGFLPLRSPGDLQPRPRAGDRRPECRARLRRYKRAADRSLQS